VGNAARGGLYQRAGTGMNAAVKPLAAIAILAAVIAIAGILIGLFLRSYGAQHCYVANGYQVCTSQGGTQAVIKPVP
jgi:hypothetical protein